MEHAEDQVLVADDSPLTRRWIGACLTLAGFQVIYASDGQQTVEQVQIHTPDLIFLDVVMPGPGVGEVVGHLKRFSDTGSYPLVLMAPPISQPSALVYRLPQCDFLLYKPIKRRELVDVAHGLLKARKADLNTVPMARVVQGLGAVLEALDPDTKAHSARVGEYSFRVGRKLGLSEEEGQNLKVGALLHDIGKVGIGGTVLARPGPLVPEEIARMRQHASQGAHIVDCFGIPRIAEEAVGHHHERWDGDGYPRGLKGEDIPLAARILAVADAYDAMVSGRPYQKAVSPSQAVICLKKERRRQFDPRVVDCFADMVVSEKGPA